MDVNALVRGVGVCASAAMFTTVAQADELLIVDLTVTDEITITATDGLSAATRSGDGITGFYLDDFYDGAVVGDPLDDALVFADLTSAESPSNFGGQLFRQILDPGLNIFGFSLNQTVTFTADSLAFVGSATWTVSPAAYGDMLAGSRSGDIYFPAGVVGDIDGASLLGTYSVIVFPEPCPADLDGDGSVGFNDLTLLLGTWGTMCDGCPEDIDGDGIVGFNDLTILLGNWGPCE